MPPSEILKGVSTLDSNIPGVRVPVHVLFFGRDWVLYDEDFEDRNIETTRKIWDACDACSFSFQAVPHTGHIFYVHSGQESGYQSVADWMKGQGFA